GGEVGGGEGGGGGGGGSGRRWGGRGGARLSGVFRRLGRRLGRRATVRGAFGGALGRCWHGDQRCWSRSQPYLMAAYGEDKAYSDPSTYCADRRLGRHTFPPRAPRHGREGGRSPRGRQRPGPPPAAP